MGAYLRYGNTISTTMRFDVVVSETHHFSSAITEHPVEKGPNVTDNVRAELDTITLEVFVSNAPINTGNLLKLAQRGAYKASPLQVPEYKPPFSASPGAVFGAAQSAIGSAVTSVVGGGPETIGQIYGVNGALTLQFSQPFNAVSEIFAELRKLRDEATIVSVITPHWDYSSMVVASVDMPRTSAEGDGARISIELKQILQVETKRTAEPVPTQTRGKQAKNKGSKGPVEATSQGASNAYYIRDGLGNFVKAVKGGLGTP